MTTALRYNRKTKYRARILSKPEDGTTISMGIRTTFIEVSKTLPAPNHPIDDVLNFNDDRKIWPTRHVEEHPFIETIRAGVLQYRLQSASHFDVTIEVHQTQSLGYAGESKQLSRSFNLEVLFHDFNRHKLYRVCRLKPHRSSRKIREISPDNIQVCDNGGHVSLHDFLDAKFPVLEVAVRADALHAWWNENGKTFHWTELPTELKERIIQFCMHPSDSPGIPHRTRQSPRKRERRRLGPYEITDRLGDWSLLLRVSHQVRAITLRLCLLGGTDIALNKGLCIVALSNHDLREKTRRLGKYYQLSEPNGVPVDDKTLALAKTYKYFPKIFPELKHYATLRHGIRRICLQMDFLGYFHLFKVTAGGFEQYWRPYYIDYAVFEQLPNLNEVIVILPDPAGRLENNSAQPGPPLFYKDFACPRILHRFIYEHAAEVLASCQNVKMDGFMDELENSRFKALRRNAINARKFTNEEFHELYSEDGGGIELDEAVRPGVQPQEAEEKPRDIQHPGGIQNSFWPPKCDCAVRCRKLIWRNRTSGLDRRIMLGAASWVFLDLSVSSIWWFHLR